MKERTEWIDAFKPSLRPTTMYLAARQKHLEDDL